MCIFITYRIYIQAAVMKKIDATPWRGASAWFSIYQPKLTNKDQFSMSFMWLNTEYNGERTNAQFGWAVRILFVLLVLYLIKDKPT